jgi:hypothetical protein
LSMPLRHRSIESTSIAKELTGSGGIALQHRRP